MNGRNLVIFVVAVAFFSFAASHRFYDSAHAIGTIKLGGGAARHPARLDKDRDSYILIATAGVVPPYRGNARVVLEGDPTLKATFHNSGPAFDLGFHRHPVFEKDTYYDLRPRDKVALWVKITRDHASAGRSFVAEAVAADGKPPARNCDFCDSDKPDGQPVAGNASVKAPGGRGERPASGSAGKREGKWRPDGADAGTGKPGGRSGAPEKGPVLAFYDTKTNERLLGIPIRFADGEEGAHGR